jgi:hypothetical protein
VPPPLVVVEAEGIQLRLQFDEITRRGPGPKPALERLVKALDLALGLRVPRRAVLLAHAKGGEQVLERVAAAVKRAV